MIRDFHGSCEGCANYVLLNKYGNRAEALEAKIDSLPRVVLVKEGYVGCNRKWHNMPSHMDAEGPNRLCQANRAIPPKFSLIIIRHAGLSVAAELTVSGAPYLIGRPSDGALLVNNVDLINATEQVSQDIVIE
jgi:hypothetical protein